MNSRIEKEDWLKRLGVQLPNAGSQTAQSAGSTPTGGGEASMSSAPSPDSDPTQQAAPAASEAPPGDAASPQDEDSAPIETSKGHAQIWPEDLVALKSALDGIQGKVQVALKQEQEIAAAGAKAKIDPKKTDAVSKAATRLGGALSPEEHSRLKRGESAIMKTKLSIDATLDRISEAKDQQSAFSELNLEEVHTEEEKEKLGHQVANAYDTLINVAKAVIDIVTGDVAKYAGWIVMQATAEVAGGDVIKDGIEKAVDGIEKQQKELEDGLNQIVGELNKFRAKELKLIASTITHLRDELMKWLGALVDDSKEFGEDLGDIAKAHSKDAGDFRPVMGVYRKISEANGLLSELAIEVSQDKALSDARWPGLLQPIGSLDENTAVGYGLPGDWIGVVYKNSGGSHVFLVSGSGTKFAASRNAAPAALEALSASFTQLQDALAAKARVAPLAADWGKALSGGLEKRAGHH